MKVITIALGFIIFFLSCDKNDKEANAQIIAFHAEKCMCCWGWDVKMGNDTIKIDSIPANIPIGYDIINPIPIYIELGPKKYDCSAFGMHEYFHIKKVEIIN
jgi:hypothetical protein